MTVATGVEIKSGETAASVLNWSPGRPADLATRISGAGSDSAQISAVRSSKSSVSTTLTHTLDAESFRSGLETLLASVQSGLDSSTEPACGAGEVSTPANSHLTESLARPAGKNLSFATGTVPSLKAATQETSTPLQAVLPASTTAAKAVQRAAYSALKGRGIAQQEEASQYTSPANSRKGVGAKAQRVEVQMSSSQAIFPAESPKSSMVGPASLTLPDSGFSNGAARSTDASGISSATGPEAPVASTRIASVATTGYLTNDSAARDKEKEPAASGRQHSGSSIGGTPSQTGESDASEAGATTAGVQPTALQISAKSLQQTQTRTTPPSSTTGFIAKPAGNGGLEQSTAIASVGTSISNQFRTSALTAGNSGAGARTGNSAQGPVRLVHAASPSVTVQHGTQLIEGQPVAPTHEGLNMAIAQDSAGLHGASDTVGTSLQDSTDPATRPAQLGTFAALDAEAAPETSSWIHAGTHHAEAGFQDPALGWVAVRADVGGSGIHASLVPGSVDAAQVLGAHLPGLNVYLAEHHTPIETLTMSPPGSGGAGMDQFANQSMNQRNEQGSGQSGGSSRETSNEIGVLAFSPNASQDIRARIAGSGTVVPVTKAVDFHISVMA